MDIEKDFDKLLEKVSEHPLIKFLDFTVLVYLGFVDWVESKINNYLEK